MCVKPGCSTIFPQRVILNKFSICNHIINYSICSSDPKLQYQLFLKATQIDIILSKLEDCITYHKQAVYHLTCRKKILETLTIELEFIQDKFERLKSVKYIKVCKKKLT